MSDTRIVYGATCTWWGSIDKVGSFNGLPCCPHCMGMLFEHRSIDVWNQKVLAWTAKFGDAAYPEFVDWTREAPFCLRLDQDGFAKMREMFNRKLARERHARQQEQFERHKSLLRSPGERPGPGCHCQPGKCMAPKIMGRQMPCLDPEKAAARPAEEKLQ